MMQKDVVIIGGGAAGLMAAIAAARCGAKTLIVEHMDRVGKKILATGNGKCNYTNENQDISCYRGEHPDFVLDVFEQFGFSQTVSLFEELGIYPKIRNGYYYPSSEQAASVLDVLRMEAAYRQAEILTDCCLKKIKKQENGFFLSTSQGEIRTKSLIFSPGLLASPKTGSDGSAFPYIERMGHHFIDVVPALVQLQGAQSFFKALAGIRAETRLTLYIDGNKKHQESGELQLTEFGISGIPVFQLSRFATRALQEKRQVFVEINFVPKLETEEVSALLKKRFHTYEHEKTAEEALVGLFNRKLIDVLLKESGIGLHVPAKQVKDLQLQKLCRMITAFHVDVIGSKGFDAAQVCAGGVDSREVDNHTLESKITPGIYFAGEVLDIDGTCGGYNLQWAWSSGYVAGMHAAEHALAVR